MTPPWPWGHDASGTLGFVELIARVEGTYGVHFVRVAPPDTRFETNVRPRPAIGSLITIRFAGLAGVNAESLEAWRARHAATGELDRRIYRPTVLADLMNAGNGALWLAFARTASADALAAFALERGGALLAAIRGELAGQVQPRRVSGAAERFAAILDIPHAREVLDELAELHAVEHLMGLEHAVVQWMRATAEPPPDELTALGRDLPDEPTSAGISAPWFQWWWRFARACTRSDLHQAVEQAVALAFVECRHGTRNALARDACDEAARLVELVRVAPGAALFADPPHPVALAELVHDEQDAHYAAYMAVSHAAHAIAAALRPTMDPGDANRQAMRLVASRALDGLR